jgi:hypothetical protein
MSDAQRAQEMIHRYAESPNILFGSARKRRADALKKADREETRRQEAVAKREAKAAERAEREARGEMDEMMEREKKAAAVAEAAEERASHLGSNKPINSVTTDSNGVIDPSTGKPLQWDDDDGWREGWKGEAKAAVAHAEEEKQNKKVHING